MAGIVFVALLCTAACDGGGKGGGGAGDFRLIQFLDNNRADIDRNRVVTFLFSAPVAPVQDFSQRLKIQSVETAPSSDFTVAIGAYVVTGDRVTFVRARTWSRPRDLEHLDRLAVDGEGIHRRSRPTRDTWPSPARTSSRT
jgi:hypothetical protein